ncbi:MAG: T9SS type A sorting domain-containing protein, partial [Bacteroidota bacterium]|nr:T9SS type A sorting domain-containing protein [Bacteroidota bacterium]
MKYNVIYNEFVNNKRLLFFPQILFITVLFTLQIFSQTITQNQTDNFQSGTLVSWTSGSSNPNPPQNISSGGPAGAADRYMRLISTGSGSGGKLVIFNSVQWAGNYSSANVSVISMHMINEGSNALHMRIVLINSLGDEWASTVAVTIPVSSGWITASFSIQEADMTMLSGTSYASVISDVATVRLLHSTSPSHNGENIAAQLGIDNITAANIPFPVELVSFSAAAKGKNVELKWNTATEINNYGFEIERSTTPVFSPLQGGDVRDGWSMVGFVEGNGTTNAPKEYSFLDKDITAEKFIYRLKQIDRDGQFEYSDEVEVMITQTPQMFALMQNYPNPFNPVTMINYQLPINSLVTLKVYDALGREVESLVSEVKEAGTYSAMFDGSKISSGIYFY